MAIKSRLDVECPTCGADPGDHCLTLAKHRYHTARQLRFSERPCGCIVYRHDGEVKRGCCQHSFSEGRRHPDMKWDPERKAFAFPT